MTSTPQNNAQHQKPRCPWCGDDPLYRAYHDEEWGVPCDDEHKLFEFLCLESAQSGLAWITILRKRDGYRAAYEGFDPLLVAEFDRAKRDELLTNPAIVRNRAKIDSSINNAARYLEIQQEYRSFARYLWRFVDGKPLQPRFATMDDVPPYTELAKTIAKDLKQHGFRFVGPTTVYSLIQAAGLSNDHLTACYRHKECERLLPKL